MYDVAGCSGHGPLRESGKQGFEPLCLLCLALRLRVYECRVPTLGLKCLHSTYFGYAVSDGTLPEVYTIANL